MNRKSDLPASLQPLPLREALLWFGIPTILLGIATHWGVPWLAARAGLPAKVAWFLMGGGLVFVPLLGAALIALRREGYRFASPAWCARVRLLPMQKADWRDCLVALLAVVAATGAMVVLAPAMLRWCGATVRFTVLPAFLEAPAQPQDPAWLLAAWLPFFVCNIFGEELLWRGVLLPRQELQHGRHAWWIHSLCWLLFHVSFGWPLLLALLPILFILPRAVQQRRNTWIGVIIHGLVNGAGFIAVTLGGV